MLSQGLRAQRLDTHLAAAARARLDDRVALPVRNREAIAPGDQERRAVLRGAPMHGDVAVSSIRDVVQIRALVLSRERRRHQAATARTRTGRAPQLRRGAR